MVRRWVLFITKIKISARIRPCFSPFILCFTYLKLLRSTNRKLHVACDLVYTTIFTVSNNIFKQAFSAQLHAFLLWPNAECFCLNKILFSSPKPQSYPDKKIPGNSLRKKTGVKEKIFSQLFSLPLYDSFQNENVKIKDVPSSCRLKTI